MIKLMRYNGVLRSAPSPCHHLVASLLIPSQKLRTQRSQSQKPLRCRQSPSTKDKQGIMMCSKRKASAEHLA